MLYVNRGNNSILMQIKLCKLYKQRCEKKGHLSPLVSIGNDNWWIVNVRFHMNEIVVLFAVLVAVERYILYLYLLNQTIGVQILDRHGKAVNKLFPGTMGKVTLLRLKVESSSNEGDWKEMVQGMFRGPIVLTTKVLTDEGYRTPTCPLDCLKLEEARKRRRAPESRVFFQVEGLGMYYANMRLLFC